MTFIQWEGFSPWLSRWDWLVCLYLGKVLESRGSCINAWSVDIDDECCVSTLSISHYWYSSICLGLSQTVAGVKIDYVCKCSTCVSTCSSLRCFCPGRGTQMAGIAFSELLFCPVIFWVQDWKRTAGTWASSCGCFSVGCMCWPQRNSEVCFMPFLPLTSCPVSASYCKLNHPAICVPSDWHHASPICQKYPIGRAGLWGWTWLVPSRFAVGRTPESKRSAKCELESAVLQ